MLRRHKTRAVDFSFESMATIIFKKWHFRVNLQKLEMEGLSLSTVVLSI